MTRALLVLSLLIAAAACAQTSAPASPKPGKLTFKQVLALAGGTPDQVTANEIRRRGLSDTLSANDLARARQAGAGPHTIEALQPFVVTPVLIVHSNQDRCEVLIDGVSRGTTGPSVPLTIRDVAPGPHTVVVRKPRYSTAEMPVTLTAGKTTEFNPSIELSVATLSVSTNAPNPHIDIEGVDLAGRSPSNLELAPGTCTIHLTAPRFLAATQEVTLKPGDSLQLRIPLKTDPSVALALAVQAQTEQTAGHYPAAFRLAANALAIDPANAQALGVEAMSAFYSGQYPLFAQFGLRALRAGGELDIPVVHRHNVRSAHLARLRLQSKTIAYNPEGQTGATCNTPAFEVPLTDIRSLELKQDNRGQRYLDLKVLVPGGRQETLVFADYRALPEPKGNVLPVLTAPPDGANEISATASLLQTAWRNSQQ